MKPSKSHNNHIFICTGKDCQKNGCDQLKSDLKKNVKVHKIKNVSLVKTKCMDYCKLGPNLVVNGELLHDCQSEDIPEILQKLENRHP
ncbi:(2Fe-2S) ferredoxin domain-containing protein [Marivirga sericea]|uniref:(2Fe-2S) ferredoxin domain-containing protein n=1 Tax=Marivirga sericea TaxID=1028 RepID=UPI000A1C7DF5|nr:(2Fe-2S) ferredoxin domain-containing protein [Marivirga sericea]